MTVVSRKRKISRLLQCHISRIKAETLNLTYSTETMYRKTSNKRPRRLFEHLTNTPRRLIETRRLLETRRLFVSCTNGKYWHPSVREMFTGTRPVSLELQILSMGNGIHSCAPIKCP